ncbi:hypothetical protein B0H14DRAFT_242924 [Mycena olivaceomarginata]|nr:hypothetical protein B0H14DRAFT_242924 [Mycena olivaceomarginata]
MRCLWLATVLSLSGFLELASAIIVNASMSRPCCSCSWPYSIRIAVDDDQPGGLNTTSIIYQPQGAWQQGIGGCDGCPPPGLASMNTFHGSLFNPKTKQASPKTSRLQLCFFSAAL